MEPRTATDRTDEGPSDQLTLNVSRDSSLRSRMQPFSPLQSEKSSLVLPVAAIQELEEDTIVTDDEEVKVSSPLAIAANEMISSKI